MTTMFRKGAAGVALAVALGMAPAAMAADNADATATAEVLSALTLTNEDGLDFGAMVLANSSGGTVSLPAAGAQTFDCDGGSGNIVCSGTTSLATFEITTGTANKSVKINLPTGNTILQHQDFVTSTNAEHRIELSNLDSDAALVADPGGDYYEVTLDGSGEESFSVGGTITLGGTEVPGIYEGTFNVSVEYS